MGEHSTASVHESHGLPKVPPELVAEINRGNCIAFVGAGFSAAAELPSWKELLKKIAESSEASANLRAHVIDVVAAPAASAHAMDQAAQMLADELKGTFTAHLRSLLVRRQYPPRMQQRLRSLRAIPFRAILTTNFDSILSGLLPGHEQYRRLLREGPTQWWQRRFWDEEPAGAETIKLHGDLLAPSGQENIVLTREDYRRRLYADTAYSSFLRSLFATSTILYLGFSFEDAYLNELRSEVLSLLGFTDREMPIAYAVVNDASPATQEHFRRHEGIHLLTYRSNEPPNFQGFDQWLQAIHAATNPLSRFGRLLAGKRILWMDPHPDNNLYGLRFFMAAAELSRHQLEPVTMTGSPESALERLSKAQNQGQPFDLVLSHWGGSGMSAAGARLLLGMRAQGLFSPVLIFAGATDADARKRLALSLGAQGYFFRFETLFRRIEELFASAEDTG